MDVLDHTWLNLDWLEMVQTAIRYLNFGGLLTCCCSLVFIIVGSSETNSVVCLRSGSVEIPIKLHWQELSRIRLRFRILKKFWSLYFSIGKESDNRKNHLASSQTAW